MMINKVISKDLINIFALFIILSLLLYFYKKSNSRFYSQLNHTNDRKGNTRNDYANIIKKHSKKKKVVKEHHINHPPKDTEMNNVFSNNPEQKDKQAYFTKMNEQYNNESSLQDEVTTTSLVPTVVY